MATEHLLRVCTIDTDPWTYVPTEDAGTDHTLDYDLPIFASAAIEKAGPGDLQCRECKAFVGMVEESRFDTYDVEHEYIVWRSVTLVQDNVKPRFSDVWALCEECSAGLFGP